MIMVENERSTYKESDQKDRISKLCLLAKAKRSKGHESVMVGWTKDGRPSIVRSEDQLSDMAKESLDAYKMSGLPIKEVASSNLIPLEYAFTGPAVDFKDKGDKKAEDLITFGVIDQNGETKKISIGERRILEAITNSNNPWQDIASTRLGEVSVEAKPMYTLFLPSQESEEYLVILFKPTISGESNEATFKSFIRQTIGRLLVLDESQEPNKRKGYLKAAAALAGVKSKSGNALDMFFKLRQLGLVDFRDEWLEGMKQRGRNITVGGLRLARTLGLVDFDDETLERYKDPLPYYDVDSLDIDKLIRLASRMYTVAREAIGYF
jgi:hypothetical protein